LSQLLRGVNPDWHGVKLGQPDWGESSHSIAFTVEIRSEKLLFHVILNAYWQPLDFELARLDNAAENRWRRWIDTALGPPHDILEWDVAEPVAGNVYRAESRSVVILLSEF
jgi:isoamylase